MHIKNQFLVSSKHILTASHCIQPKGQQRYYEQDSFFVLGAYNLERPEQESQKIDVARFITHPDWNFNTNNHDADVAIAILRTPVIYNKYIRPICLPPQLNSHDDIVGQYSYAAGWGSFCLNYFF
jgi:hypothetical protein